MECLIFVYFQVFIVKVDIKSENFSKGITLMNSTSA